MTTETTSRISAPAPSPADVILNFWFGELDAGGRCDEAHRNRWWAKDPDFDREIQEKFGHLYAEVVSPPGYTPPWAKGPRGLLAAIIVLDQFSRNMFRSSAGMYAADALARSYAFEVIALGYDKKLPVPQRCFAYMPLMHSERLEDQHRCVELFQSFATELTGDDHKAVSSNADYAVQHRDIVARFGRFPHRNKIVGRESTAEEQEFLKGSGSSF